MAKQMAALACHSEAAIIRNLEIECWQPSHSHGKIIRANLQDMYVFEYAIEIVAERGHPLGQGQHCKKRVSAGALTVTKPHEVAENG